MACNGNHKKYKYNTYITWQSTWGDIDKTEQGPSSQRPLQCGLGPLTLSDSSSAGY